MSTVIKPSCPDCGQQRIAPADMHLIVCIHAPALNTYSFTCPGCGARVTKRADERDIDVLITNGVVLRLLRIPDEAHERHDGPALTLLDLARFCQALAGVECVAGEAA